VLLISTKISDLERHNGPYIALFCWIHNLFWPII